MSLAIDISIICVILHAQGLTLKWGDGGARWWSSKRDTTGHLRPRLCQPKPKPARVFHGQTWSLNPKRRKEMESLNIYPWLAKSYVMQISNLYQGGYYEHCANKMSMPQHASELKEEWTCWISSLFVWQLTSFPMATLTNRPLLIGRRVVKEWNSLLRQNWSAWKERLCACLASHWLQMAELTTMGPTHTHTHRPRHRHTETATTVRLVTLSWQIVDSHRLIMWT